MKGGLESKPKCVCWVCFTPFYIYRELALFLSPHSFYAASGKDYFINKTLFISGKPCKLWQYLAESGEVSRVDWYVDKVT